MEYSIPGSVISHQALRWLLHATNKCEASIALFTILALGMDTFREHPEDIYSFERCQELKLRVPEVRDRFDQMAAVSMEWFHFVKNWDEITALIAEQKRVEAQEMIEKIAFGATARN